MNTPTENAGRRVQEARRFVESRKAITEELVGALARESPGLQIVFGPEPDRLEKMHISLLAESIVLECHGLQNGGLLFGSGEKELRQILIAACRDHVAYTGVRHGLAEVIRQERPLHPYARNWLAKFLRQEFEEPAKAKGPDPYPNRQRDVLVVSFLEFVQELGFPVTRNEVSYGKQSACDIVAEVYADSPNIVSAKSLMNIWSKRGKGPFPG